MPYIKQEKRKEIDQLVSLPGDVFENPGELNYFITQTICLYLRNKGLSYQTCNDIVGALDNVKHEFQRRVQDKYEDIKIVENGDILDYVVLEDNIDKRKF